jgi:large subunit ribosomal protein L10
MNISLVLGQKKQNFKELKAKKVEELTELAKNAKVIAIADLRNLPDKHLQALRKKLRNDATIVVTKNALLQRALKQAGKASELIENLNAPSAVIFTNMDPFKLYKIIRQSRGKAAAKPGQIAPFDIIVPKGETSLAPGPVLTELKQAGIQAQIAAGKVVIGKDSVVVKAGEKIGDIQAKALQKLGVEPFEVGVELIAAWEGGIVYPKTVLHIDEAAFMQKLQSAASMAFNLSFNSAYPTKANIKLLLGKAVIEGKALALEANIYEKDSIGMILAKANAQASALKAKVG